MQMKEKRPLTGISDPGAKDTVQKKYKAKGRKNQAWVRCAAEILLVILVIVCVIAISMGNGAAEGTERVWVLCMKDSYVRLRTEARKSSDEFGGSTCGTMLETDGRSRNGFLHVVNVPAEESDGWVHSGYIVYDEPVWVNRMATVVSNGRLAARKYVGGKVQKWLKPMSEIRVYYVSSEWSLTSAGYVQTQFLELDGEN